MSSVKKGASKYAIDVINSAINNTKRMQGVDVADLYVSNLIANGGPMLKRFRAASMGRAGMIKKRTSHITVELDLIPKGEHPRNAHTDKQDKKEVPAVIGKVSVKDKHPKEKKHITKKGKE